MWQPRSRVSYFWALYFQFTLCWLWILFASISGFHLDRFLHLVSEQVLPDLLSCLLLCTVQTKKICHSQLARVEVRRKFYVAGICCQNLTDLCLEAIAKACRTNCIQAITYNNPEHGHFSRILLWWLCHNLFLTRSTCIKSALPLSSFPRCRTTSETKRQIWTASYTYQWHRDNCWMQ